MCYIVVDYKLFQLFLIIKRLILKVNACSTGRKSPKVLKLVQESSKARGRVVKASASGAVDSSLIPSGSNQ